MLLSSNKNKKSNDILSKQLEFDWPYNEGQIVRGRDVNKATNRKYIYRICPVCEMGRFIRYDKKRGLKCTICAGREAGLLSGGGNRIEKICKVCGRKFNATLHKEQQCCSRKCSDKKRRTKITRICKSCGEKFEIFLFVSKIKGLGNFCCTKCYGEWRSKYIRGSNHPKWIGPISKVCLFCGKEFEVPQSNKNQKFCSRRCSDSWRSRNIIGKNHPNWKGGKAKVICKRCGKEFEVSQSKKETVQFCSKECAYANKKETGCFKGEKSSCWKGKVEKTCINCGKEFLVYPHRASTVKYCSVICYIKYMSENNNREVTCDYCGKVFRIELNRYNYYKHYFCGRKCMGGWQSSNFKRLWQNPEYVKKIREAWDLKPNKLEKFFDGLTPDCVRYVGDFKFHVRTKKQNRFPDFVIKGQNKVIELYGDFFHRNDEPKNKIQEYREVGLECIIFWEHEVYNETEGVIKQVEDFIKI